MVAISSTVWSAADGEQSSNLEQMSWIFGKEQVHAYHGYINTICTLTVDSSHFKTTIVKYDVRYDLLVSIQKRLEASN